MSEPVEQESGGVDERAIQMTRALRSAMDRMDQGGVYDLLSQGASPNDPGEREDPPLIYAVKKARESSIWSGDAWAVGLNVEIALLLLEAGADLELRDRSEESTALRWSAGIICDQGHWLTMKLLERGANPNAVDRFKNAPIHGLARDGFVRLNRPAPWSAQLDRAIKALIEGGADLSLRGSDGDAAETFAKADDELRSGWIRAQAERQALSAAAKLPPAEPLRRVAKSFGL